MKKLITLLTIFFAVMAASPDAWAKKRKRRRKKSITKSEVQHKNTKKKKRKKGKKSSQSKKEVTEWEKRKEALTPEQLKDVIEENHRLKTQQAELADKADVDQEELERLKKLREKINELRRERGLAESDDDLDLSSLFVVQEQTNAAQEGKTTGNFDEGDWAIDENGKPYLKGLSFKVQIGAYRKHDLTKVLESNQSVEAFEQETINGLHVFTIRHFRNYWKANKFKKEVRALGIKDAYIVCFVDGKRVSLKSVLAKVRQQEQ